MSIQTWGAFADLCEPHNGGGFGGCWCTWFHRETHSAPAPSTGQRTYDERYAATRDVKRGLVETGRAHAALVFDGDTAVDWAQYGSPAELPGISHRKDVLIFVDRRYRHRGIPESRLREGSS